MTDPRVFKLDEFRGGRILGYTETGGSFPVMAKENGEVLIRDVTYPAGSLVLFDQKGTIVGPFAFPGALDLAERVLDGDQRALTDSRTLLTLASAVVGFSISPEPTEPAAAALEAEVAAHV